MSRNDKNHYIVVSIVSTWEGRTTFPKVGGGRDQRTHGDNRITQIRTFDIKDIPECLYGRGVSVLVYSFVRYFWVLTFLFVREPRET